MRPVVECADEPELAQLSNRMTPSGSEVRFEELPEADYPEWDAFVDASVEKSPFSKLAWLQAHRETSTRHSFAIAVSRNKAGEIAAGVALLKRSKPLSSDELVVPPLHPCNSLLIRILATTEPDRVYSHRNGYAAALAKFLRSQGFFSCRLVHHPRVTDVRPFVWDGWTIGLAYTFFVDLGALNGIATFSGPNRSRHRKCVEAGFRITSSNAVGEAAAIFMPLIEATYRRRGMEPRDYGLDALPTYFRVLDPQNALLYFAASTADGTVVAARVLVPSADGMVHDWVAGTDPEYLKSGVTAFLVAEILLELQRRGYRTFDFGGANTPGVADFKQGFNGALVFGFDTVLPPVSVKNRLVAAAADGAHQMRQFLRSFTQKNHP